MGRKAGLAVAGALTLGLAACGDSDDETAVADVPDVTEAMAEDEMADDAMSDDDAMMEEGEPVTFTVTIENLTDSTEVPTPLAPGVGVAHGDGGDPIVEGVQASAGLEALAEDGAADGFGAETGGVVFAVPSSGTEPGPAVPGDSYSFEITATPGHALSFATMFVQSNDWFFAPGPGGIALFDADGNPLTGDVTDRVYLWDAGPATG